MSKKAREIDDFHKKSFQHLDDLWQTAVWVTESERDAENLVMNTFIEASRFCDGSDSKAN